MKLAKVTKDGSRSLYGQFLTMTLLPLVVSGIVMILVASYAMKYNMQQEAGEGLNDVAIGVLNTYDCIYPGEYDVRAEDGQVVLYKGDARVSDDFELIDRMHDERNLEISIFFMDTRLITTLKDENGERRVGSIAAEQILREVYEKSSPKFYNNVEIGKRNYYAYYEPIISQDGSTCLGMIGVAKPAESVEKTINRSVWSNIIIMGLAIAVTALFIIMFANQIVLMIKYMIDFMKKLADNKLDAVLNEGVTHREDELGVMGRILVDLQISIRRLIERDVLTGLYNRRSAEGKIDRIEKDGINYCVSIGDIDFFKKFNDSFGHECGDIVLKEVAKILNTNMNGKGFVARWGGEEFLLVYENAGIDEAYVALMGIREDLHEKEIEYEGNIHKVTMTFGVAQREDNVSISQLINVADDKLYEGKKGGRDRVIK